MAAIHDLLEALSSMGVLISVRNGRLSYRPRSAMTPDILSAVRDSKSELIELLSKPVAGSKSKADREWDRFLSVAVVAEDGSLQDPSEPVLRRGVTGEEWARVLATAARLRAQRRVNDCGRLRLAGDDDG